MDNLDTSKLTSSQKAELMTQIKTQVMLANAQAMLSKITESCYTKCIGKPGGSLDSSDQKCLGLCMDRYLDAQNIVSRTLAGRIQRESGAY